MLKRLAEALGTTSQVLSGVPPGEETLSDLRRFAGLDRALAATLLARKRPQGAARATAWKLQMVESGREVAAWKDPVVLGQVIAAMAEVYATSPRVVRLAWFRVLPGQAHLLRLRGREPIGPSEGAAVGRHGGEAMWGRLNARQRAFLVACFRADQAAQADAEQRRFAGQRPGEAVRYRKLPFRVKADVAFVGYTALQEELRRLGKHGAGAEGTLHALARRGLIELSEDQVEVVPLGFVPRLLVELTRQGRECARFGLGESEPARGTAALLSEWLWRALVAVASCGDQGLAERELWGRARFYLGTGFRPGGAMSRGFIDVEPVREGLGAEAYVREYRWKATDAGLRHIAEYVDIYRARYPQVATDQLPTIKRRVTDRVQAE